MSKVDDKEVSKEDENKWRLLTVELAELASTNQIKAFEVFKKEREWIWGFLARHLNSSLMYEVLIKELKDEHTIWSIIQIFLVVNLEAGTRKKDKE